MTSSSSVFRIVAGDRKRRSGTYDDDVDSSARWARLTRLVQSAVHDLFDQSEPFGRLALIHTIFSVGTTFITISLAGTLFFTITPEEAKGKVVLYLLLTITPFAVVAPAMSPLLDRGAYARRTSMAVASLGSAVLVFLMAGDIKGILLFPEAFGVLVLSKLYLVAKAALVPSMTETEDDLASANAKLAVLASLAGFVASPLAVGVLQLGAAVGTPSRLCSLHPRRRGGRSDCRRAGPTRASIRRQSRKVVHPSTAAGSSEGSPGTATSADDRSE